MSSPHAWDAKMEALARTDPAALVEQMRGFPDVRLSFAAEYLGMHAPSDIAAPVLLPLLSHATPVVREGALQGLYGHRLRPDVQAEVRRVAAADAIPELRDMAAGLIEDEVTL